MNKPLVVGVLMGAGIGVACVRYCLNDEVIAQKVNEASLAVKNFVDVVAQKKREVDQKKKDTEQESIRQNQEWAEQQWEALGI